MAQSGDALLMGEPGYVGRGDPSTQDIYLTGPDGSHPRSIFSSARAQGARISAPTVATCSLAPISPRSTTRQSEFSVVLVDLSWCPAIAGAADFHGRPGNLRPGSRSYFPYTGSVQRQNPSLRVDFPATWRSACPRPKKRCPSCSIRPPPRRSVWPGPKPALTRLAPFWVGEGQGGKCLIVAWQRWPRKYPSLLPDF